MRFKVAVKDLNDALSKLVKITSGYKINPILNNVLVESVGNSGLKLTATDLGITIEISIMASVEVQGKVALPAHKLQQVISSFNSMVYIVVNDSYCAEISEGKSKVKIAGMSANEFPRMDKNITGQSIKIPSEILVDGLKRTVFATIGYDTNNVLSGVSVEIKPGNMEFAAINYNVLAVFNYANNTDQELSAIIPFQSVHEIIKLCKDNETLEISINKSQACFNFETGRLVTSLLCGNYPRYKQLIPNYDKKAVINRQELVKTLQMVDIIAKEQKKQKENKSPAVQFIFNQGVLEVVYNYLQEEVKSSIICDFTDDYLSIYFNSDYLIEILKQFDTVNVVIELGGNLSAAIFRPENEDNYLCLLMPMQIKEA